VFTGIQPIRDFMNVVRALVMVSVCLSARPLVLFSQAPVHFHFAANTGNNATIAVPASVHPTVSGIPLVSGDEIGVFTPEGICVGAVVWTEVNAAITVWGDDDQTSQLDGARAGDRLRFRVWSHATDTEHDSVAVVFAEGDGTYVANAMIVVSSLGGIPTAVDHPSGSASMPGRDRLRIHPNPFNPTTTIVFRIDQAENVHVWISDVRGRRIAEIIDGQLPAATHRVHCDGTALASGVYVCRIITGSYSESRLMLLIR
jgi:hypothetical protein